MSEAELGAEPGRVRNPRTLPTEYVRRKNKAQERIRKVSISPHHGEATKSLRWMPRRQVPKKDVGHCEKPREAVYRR